MSEHIMVRVSADCVYRQGQICLVDLGPKDEILKAIQGADDMAAVCDLTAEPDPVDKIIAGLSSQSRDKIKRIKRIIQEFGNPGVAVKDVLFHAVKQGMTEDEARSTLEVLCEKGDVIKTLKGEVMLV